VLVAVGVIVRVGVCVAVLVGVIVGVNATQVVPWHTALGTSAHIPH
jgi:hypothetical protein